jgi:hypothetical protein
VSLPAKGGGKVRLINKVINQFASSMKHRPFINDMDKSRTLVFIAALSDVITQQGSNPIKRPETYKATPYVLPTEEQKEQARLAISEVRDNLRKGKSNELDDTES